MTKLVTNDETFDRHLWAAKMVSHQHAYDSARGARRRHAIETYMQTFQVCRDPKLVMVPVPERLWRKAALQQTDRDVGNIKTTGLEMAQFMEPALETLAWVYGIPSGMDDLRDFVAEALGSGGERIGYLIVPEDFLRQNLLFNFMNMGGNMPLVFQNEKKSDCFYVALSQAGGFRHRSTRQFHLWQLPDHTQGVEFALTLAELAHAAQGGDYTLPKRGLDNPILLLDGLLA